MPWNWEDWSFLLVDLPLADVKETPEYQMGFIASLDVIPQLPNDVCP